MSAGDAQARMDAWRTHSLTTHERGTDYMFDAPLALQPHLGTGVYVLPCHELARYERHQYQSRTVIAAAHRRCEEVRINFARCLLSRPTDILQVPLCADHVTARTHSRITSWWPPVAPPE